MCHVAQETMHSNYCDCTPAVPGVVERLTATSRSRPPMTLFSTTHKDAIGIVPLFPSVTLISVFTRDTDAPVDQSRLFCA